MTRIPYEPERCPHCSFQPESLSDYCDKHRPVSSPEPSGDTAAHARDTTAIASHEQAGGARQDVMELGRALQQASIHVGEVAGVLGIAPRTDYTHQDYLDAVHDFDTARGEMLGALSRLTREHDQAVQAARLDGARAAITAAQSICESRASSRMEQTPVPRISEANEASKCARAIGCFWQDAVPKDDPLYVKWSLIPEPASEVQG